MLQVVGILAIDIVLFLASSALAVAALGIIVYRGIPDRSTLRVEPATKVSDQPVAKIEQEPEPQPISEAPAPFSDDNGFSATKKASLPTDTTALSTTSPFLVISVPKTVHRTRSKTTRKRRATKIDSIPTLTEPPVTGTPVQSVDNPTAKGPSEP
jgi:hypothetical protein